MNHTNLQGHHFGCAKVMAAIENGLAAKGAAVIGRVDGKLDWRQDQTTLDLIKAADAVLINGEGSMHSGKKKAGWLMDVATHPATAGKETSLINTLYLDNPPEWFERLAAFDHIYARDSRSAEIMSKGIGRPVPYLGDLSMYEGIQTGSGKREEIILGDSVRNSVSRKLADLSNEMAKDHSVRCIPMTTSMREINPYRPWLARKFRQVTVALRQKRLLQKYPKLEYLPSADAYIEALKSASLSVTGRFHATTLAIATKTPFVCIKSNTWKIEALLEDIGFSFNRMVDASELSVELILEQDWSLTTDENQKIDIFFENYLKQVDQMFAVLTSQSGRAEFA